MRVLTYRHTHTHIHMHITRYGKKKKVDKKEINKKDGNEVRQVRVAGVNAEQGS